MSVPRPISPWWALLAAPVALAAGWVAGGMPVPLRPAPEPHAAEARPARVASPVEPRARSLGAPGLDVAVVEPSAVAPGETAAALAPGDSGKREAAPVPAAPSPPPNPIFSEWTTYDEAMRLARENGKPVLLDFNAEWCGPCQALRREVFDAAAAGATVRSAVIPVSLVDRVRETGENPVQLQQLQRQFQVEAFPTLVVFSPQTGRVFRRVGYAGDAETLRWITEAAAALR